MPAQSRRQHDYIMSLRKKFSSEETTPKKYQWIWSDDWSAADYQTLPEYHKESDDWFLNTFFPNTNVKMFTPDDYANNIQAALLNEDKKEARVKYGCLMLSIDDSEGFIKGLRDLIPGDYIYDEPGFGKEENTHLTLMYGFTDDGVLEDLKADMQSRPPVKVIITGISAFINDDVDYDVIKLDVQPTEELLALRADLLKTYPNEQTHPEYIPHITLAYVKKGQASPEPEAFDREDIKTFESSDLEYSPADGESTFMKLAGESGYNEETYLEFTKKEILDGVDDQLYRREYWYKDLKEKLGAAGIYIKNFYPKYVEFQIKSAKGGGKFYTARLFFSDGFAYIQKNFKFGDYDIGDEADQKAIVDDIKYYVEDIISNGDIQLFCECPSFLYHGFKYIATQLDYEEPSNPETRFPKRNNPDVKGTICKHLQLLLNRIDGNTSFKELIVKAMTGKFLDSEIKRRYNHNKIKPDWWKKHLK